MDELGSLWVLKGLAPREGILHVECQVWVLGRFIWEEVTFHHIQGPGTGQHLGDSSYSVPEAQRPPPCSCLLSLLSARSQGSTGIGAGEN